jgi:hypothetical protein
MLFLLSSVGKMKNLKVGLALDLEFFAPLLSLLLAIQLNCLWEPDWSIFLQIFYVF